MQTITMDGFCQTTGHNVPRPTFIEMSNLAAPVQQQGLLQRARRLAARDVVEFTAEGIKGVHGLTTLSRQQLYWPKERTSNNALAQ